MYTRQPEVSFPADKWKKKNRKKITLVEAHLVQPLSHKLGKSVLSMFRFYFKTIVGYYECFFFILK